MSKATSKQIEKSTSKPTSKQMSKGLNRGMNKDMSKGTGKFMRWMVLCLAIVFILLGIQRGESLDVLRKAVNICMECIGIG